MTTPTYFTVQMSASAPGGEHCIHLGRDTDGGGLGDNICGNSRHAWDTKGVRYGFSANGGGHTDPDAWPCGGCLRVLDHNPGRVRGLFKDLFVPSVAEPTLPFAVVRDGKAHVRWRDPHDGEWELFNEDDAVFGLWSVTWAELPRPVTVLSAGWAGEPK